MQPASSHERRAAHLAVHRFKPGTSGNSAGRAAGRKDLLLIVGGEPARQRFWRYVYSLAMAGDTAAMKLLADRLDPVRHQVEAVIEEKPAQELDLTRLDAAELDVLLQLAQKAAPSAPPPRDPDPDRTIN